MVRKIKQWVPIDGTRWRNQIANRHENHRVGAHYGVAHGGGVMAPLRELLNTAGLCGLCGLRLTVTSITDQPREASHCKTASEAVQSATANGKI
jgi:hypothetical protein